MSKEKVTTYRMRSLRRLSSATSSGSVAKRASSATIRERTSLIWFLTAAISGFVEGKYRAGNLKRTPGMDSRASLRESSPAVDSLGKSIGMRVFVSAVSLQSGFHGCQWGADDTMVLIHTPQCLCWLAFSFPSVTSVLFWRRLETLT